MIVRKRKINKNSKPYIIAEIGSNFDQDFNKAKQLIDVAYQAGVSGVKFQLFKTSNLYNKSHAYYKIFKNIELNQDWIVRLKKFANSKNLDFICSPFDLDSAIFLRKIKIDCFKIASSELTNIELTKFVASTRFPTFISTGMSDLNDIENAVSLFRLLNNDNIALLQCTSLYPCPIRLAHLNAIKVMSEKFNLPVGLSDHTLDDICGIVSVGLGARIFEKHITLNKSSDGPDHFYALTPKELKSYVEKINLAYKALGNNKKVFLNEERLISRRTGIYCKKNLKKGDIVKENNIKFLAPSLGIDSKHKKLVLGAKLQKDIKKNEHISWDDLSIL